MKELENQRRKSVCPGPLVYLTHWLPQQETQRCPVKGKKISSLLDIILAKPKFRRYLDESSRPIGLFTFAQRIQRSFVEVPCMQESK